MSVLFSRHALAVAICGIFSSCTFSSMACAATADDSTMVLIDNAVVNSAVANDVAAEDGSTRAGLQFDPIVVTATRNASASSRIPARIEVINSRTLTQSPITDLPHVLQQNSSLNMVQSGGLGQQTSLFIRGNNSNHTLVLKDGVRLNTASTGAANMQFLDTGDLARVEVLKGPASVLYGSDAIGGVVQLLSQTPTKNGAFFTGQVGERNTYKALLGGDMVHDILYAQIRAQRMGSEGSIITDRVGTNIQPAGYDQSGVSAKVGLKDNGYDVSLDYWGNQGNSDYDAFNKGALNNQDFKQQGANLRADYQLLPSLKVNARLSQFKDDLEQNKSADFIHSTTQQVEGYATWQVLPQHQLLIGATQQQLHGDILSFGSPYDEKIKSTGYFAQHQFQNDRLNTQLGVRLEDNDKFGQHTVGQAAARYQIAAATGIYANIGSAFKAPTLNDLYGFGGNVNLKPETALSYEIGLDQYLNDRLSVGISGFKNRVKNLISSTCVATCNGDWVTTFPVYQNLNINRADMQGGELYAEWQAAPWFSRVSYQYVKTTDQSTDKDLVRRPRQNLSLSAGWDNRQYGATVSLAAKSAALVDTSAQSTPGYATVDVSGYWQFNPQIRVFANVENVADTHYKTASYDKGIYYINGGRLASIGATFRY